MTSCVPDKAEVDAKRYVETLLHRLIEEYKFILPSGLVYGQLPTGQLPTRTTATLTTAH